MGIPEHGAGTGSGSPAATTAQCLAEGSDSRRCHRRRGWLGQKMAGSAPLGSPKGYGNRNFPQAPRTGLRLDRADAGQSGRPNYPPGAPARGASSVSHGPTPRAPARPRRGPAAGHIPHAQRAAAERREARAQAPTSSCGWAAKRGRGDGKTGRDTGRQPPGTTHNPMGTPLLERRTAMHLKRPTGAAPARPDSSPTAYRKSLLNRHPQASGAGAETRATSCIGRAEPRTPQAERQTRARRAGNRPTQRLGTIRHPT